MAAKNHLPTNSSPELAHVRLGCRTPPPYQGPDRSFVKSPDLVGPCRNHLPLHRCRFSSLPLLRSRCLHRSPSFDAHIPISSRARHDSARPMTETNPGPLKSSCRLQDRQLLTIARLPPS
ncbi:hypothetical protein L484_006318 [Morus notabilis]|uniref:Uncharacterized protein n=1 Tax=Morus notabilis TaxID=981085 RepID=W9QIU5_9ROSA|nr:hypothetical protein L484_006318 [Morus notabilis]